MEPDGRSQKLIIEQSWSTQKYRITHPVIRTDTRSWPTVEASTRLFSVINSDWNIKPWRSLFKLPLCPASCIIYGQLTPLHTGRSRWVLVLGCTSQRTKTTASYRFWYLTPSLLQLVSTEASGSWQLNWMSKTHRSTFFFQLCSIFLPSAWQDPDKPNRKMTNNNLINWGLRVTLFGSTKEEWSFN